MLTVLRQGMKGTPTARFVLLGGRRSAAPLHLAFTGASSWCAPRASWPTGTRRSSSGSAIASSPSPSPRRRATRYGGTCRIRGSTVSFMLPPPRQAILDINTFMSSREVRWGGLELRPCTAHLALSRAVPSADHLVRDVSHPRPALSRAARLVRLVGDDSTPNARIATPYHSSFPDMLICDEAHR